MRDVGIVMPVYLQKPSYLQEAIETILNQTYTDFRFIIVIDGVSEQMGPQIRQLTAHDKRVEILENDRNMGVSASLNRGFEPLFEDPDIRYITWVSSDNRTHPYFIELLRHELVLAPEEVGLVYSCFREIDGEGRPLRDEAFQEEFRRYQDKPKEELLDVCIVGVSFMYKSSYARKINGYHMEPVEDYEYWLRLSDLCDLRYIPVELVEYRVDSDFSISARLKGSIEQHRRWRHAFRLTKMQARRRKNIPLETTIYLPVTEASEKLPERLDQLLDQYYSNFQVVVVDVTSAQCAPDLLRDIKDPLLSFRSFPGAAPVKAVCACLEELTTPFASVAYREKDFEYMDLQILTNALRAAPAGTLSVSYNSSRSDLAYRFDPRAGMPSTELFLSARLKELLLK
ncbi:glycosyltransferase family A protein [Paenibacillus lutrae]|uniref:Glycosyltransferase n=1 Tax=Paenibacillus lutrae TaxID=2078573 RepID=A0A7X3FE19_9BACL|nr:glycosyltransferase family 2 protein [Paenibacillus lutrae]MVO97962.1 glycosyltransferase [Paenibacillus lutrae]